MCGEDAVLWVHARCVERCVAVEQLLERSARARWRDVRGFLGQFGYVEQVLSSPERDSDFPVWKVGLALYTGR